VAEFYDEEIEESLSRIVSLLEPMILVVMAESSPVSSSRSTSPFSTFSRKSEASSPHVVDGRPETGSEVALQDGIARSSGDEARARALAETHGLPYADVGHFRPIRSSSDDSDGVDAPVRFHPGAKEGNAIWVIVSDPTDVVRLDELETLLGVPLRLRVGSALGDQGHAPEIRVDPTGPRGGDGGVSTPARLRDGGGEEALSIDRISQDASPIIKLVDSVIFNAIQRRASTSTSRLGTTRSSSSTGSTVSSTKRWPRSTSGTTRRSSGRIKVMSELDIAENGCRRTVASSSRSETGRSTSASRSCRRSTGDSVIRILDKESTNKEFKNLSLDVVGWTPTRSGKSGSSSESRTGWSSSTGPTGSGKTTTLYACLSEIQSPEDKIITIEDPVEYQLSGITQIRSTRRKGLTFARGLRSILRHDPDKVMVGEIRDNETADIRVQAAAHEGHLVFTTVHANNVVDVLGRFLNMKSSSTTSSRP